MISPVQQRVNIDSDILEKVEARENQRRSSNLRFVSVPESSEGCKTLGFVARVMPQVWGCPRSAAN